MKSRRCANKQRLVRRKENMTTEMLTKFKLEIRITEAESTSAENTKL